MKTTLSSLRLAAGLLALTTPYALPAFADDMAGQSGQTSQSGMSGQSNPSGQSSQNGMSGAANSRTTTDTSMNQPTSGTSQSGVMTEVSVKELNKSPEKFAGQDVMVKGKISRLEGAGAFILEGSGLLNNRILVVIAKQQQAGIAGQEAGTKAPVIKEKAKVQLTGKVEQIELTKIEEQYSPGFKAEIKEEFQGSMPVLIVPPNGVKMMK